MPCDWLLICSLKSCAYIDKIYKELLKRTKFYTKVTLVFVSFNQKHDCEDYFSRYVILMLNKYELNGKFGAILKIEELLINLNLNLNGLSFLTVFNYYTGKKENFLSILFI